MATSPELERLRRSLAMLAPGQPAGLTREEAMGLLAEVRRASAELDRLVTGLRALLDETPEPEGLRRSLAVYRHMR